MHPNMAPKHKKDTEDAIDKRRVRRPRVVLRTLPPIVFSTPNNIVTLQLTMSASGVKAQPGKFQQLFYMELNCISTTCSLFLFPRTLSARDGPHKIKA